MKKALLLLVAISLVAPAALADPPPESGIVSRSTYNSWVWMWGETGPSLLMGFTLEQLYSVCTDECVMGSEECPTAVINNQLVNVPGVEPFTQKIDDAPALLLPDPNIYGFDICGLAFGIGAIAEGSGRWRDTWTGVACPETEQRSWRAHGNMTTFGENPVALNYHGNYHCVWTCDNGIPMCFEEVTVSVRDDDDD